MVEDTTQDGDRIQVRVAARPRQHVAARAADIEAGGVLIQAGQLLNASRIGAAAATGAEAIDVFARPVVAIVATGDELTPPGRPLAPGHVYEINRFTLGSVLGGHGAEATFGPPVADTMADLSSALEAGRAADVIVVSGGSSVGERDLLRDAVAAAGAITFHGVAIKPGKPFLFGHVGTTPLFGLPGNPTSCLSNAYMFVVPFVRRIARLPMWEPRTMALPLARGITSAPGKHQFYTVRVVDGQAVPAFKASGDITSMAHADGYIEIAADAEAVEAGTVVEVRLF
jgi:molybdenum cofactor synthesis domain-containing protein